MLNTWSEREREGGREREREREKEKKLGKNRGPLKRPVFLINFILHFKIS